MDTIKSKIKRKWINRKGEILIESVVAFFVLIIVLAGVTTLVLTSTRMNKNADINAKELETEIVAAENDTVSKGAGGTLVMTMAGGTEITENVTFRNQKYISYFVYGTHLTAQDRADSALYALYHAFTKLNYNRQNLDGISSHTEGTSANSIYIQLDSEQQKYVDSISWSFVKTSYGFRIYFTTTNYGTASIKPVKVYKYNGETEKYQFTIDGAVKDGMVQATGSKWIGGDGNEWSDTIN